MLQGTVRSAIVLGALVLLTACGTTTGTGSAPAPSATLASSSPSIPLQEMERRLLDAEQANNASRLEAERQLALQQSTPVQPPTTGDQERQRAETAAILILGGNSTMPATQWGHGAHAGLFVTNTR